MNQQTFELGYEYGKDMREVPKNRTSMQSYVDSLIKNVKTYPSPPSEPSVRMLIRDLGDIGTYARILGKLEAAERALETSLGLIDQFKISLRTWALHNLRYGEVLRAKKDYFGAEAAGKSIVEMGTRFEEAKELEDFAFQFLGKLYFDQGLWDKAEINFLKAFFKRQKKGEAALAEVSRQSLKILKTKKPPL